MSSIATSNVIAPQDLAWHQTELGRDFWVTGDLVGTQYSALFSAQLTKFGPGGGSAPHRHDYNHAFYFVSGTGRVRLGAQFSRTTPGTFVKVPADMVHSLVNVGSDDLVFLVIYDPPHVATD